MNSSHASNAHSSRLQPNSLETRSLSPNVQMIQSYHDLYQHEMPVQQFYHSMPHKSTALDVNAISHERISPHSRTMMHRTLSPQLQMQSSTSYMLQKQQQQHTHPVDDFNEQYNRLQQARMQQQMKTQTEALLRKQQTFAMRQKLNPPMSRQASAVNLNQMHGSTQTISSPQNIPMVQPPASINGQYAIKSFERNTNSGHALNKPNHLQLQQEHQHLFQLLQNDFRANAQFQSQLKASASAATNPFQTNAQLQQYSSDIHAQNRESGAQSPVHQTLVYKEPISSSSAQSTPTKLLKSPKTKRQPTALVTFSGWLYKQGSEGLRVWRKRWFVLSDYCLFYYKSPEEDKLLGSILLPSYTLSECLPMDNKAYRKFSFKLEHKNMRTYYLASENADYMRKWMRVIRAATLMQNFSEVQTRNMLTTSMPINTNISEGYEGRRSHQRDHLDRFGSSDQGYPAGDLHSSLNPFLNFDEDNERQPLYVNAPPKPRRSHNDAEYPMMASETMFTISTETSKESTPKSLPHRMFGEYEEVYNERENQLKNIPIDYYPDAACSPSYDNELALPHSRKPYHQKLMPPRPRSADFLEYESKRKMRQFKDFDRSDEQKGRLTCRPKSSLDINSSIDNYYYSEASYAAKMRQSALYLQNRKLMPAARVDRESRRSNTLRYEHERKRMSNEFNSYGGGGSGGGVNYAIGNNSLPSNFQRPPSRFSAISGDGGSQQFSLLMRSNDNDIGGSGLSNENRYLLDADNIGSAFAENYRSNDQMCRNASSLSIRDEDRFNLSTKNNEGIWNQDISAGTLLSKTHEELVLLLIQLRRQNDAKERLMCRGYNDMQTIQHRLNSECGSTGTRLELMGRLEVLREEVSKLEKQYEKNKPLVNLVDNMVKLGALYQAGSIQWDSNSPNFASGIQQLRSNQKELERRLQLDEEKEWDKHNPKQIELHNKVQQLYELDQRLQEESNSLHILQQDKDDIEGALEELNRKFATNRILPESFVTTKKIQHSLELELSKIHCQLAINARKLEQTVSGNSRLERELLVLRQKLQASRGKSTKHISTSAAESAADAFETELRKVKSSVGDMKRQRQELSLAVSQLTLDSNTIHERSNASPDELSTKSLLQTNKRLVSDWTETDLDLMYKKNHLIDLMGSNESTEGFTGLCEPGQYYPHAGADEAHALSSDEYWQGNDKQEIKTVRIVKRESERRQRDKEKVNPTFESNLLNNISELKSSDELNEFLSTYQAEPRICTFYEDDLSTATASDDQLCISPPSAVKITPTIRSVSNALNNTNSTSSNNNNNDNTVTDLFQSNTARQIFNELSIVKGSEQHDHGAGKQDASDQIEQYKRLMPRKKKRHNTAPNSEGFIDYLNTERNTFKYNNHRARDDLDMEVVLRSNLPTETISGPPDIVRSALGQGNTSYLFDNIDKLN